MAGLRSAADDPPPDHTRGSLPLGFGGEYVELGMRGFLGAMPVVVWLVISAVPFEETIAASQVSGAMSAVVASTLGFAALVLPWLVPCLVLRARQPRGARIEWDERTVVEWDGPWRADGDPVGATGAAARDLVLDEPGTDLHAPCGPARGSRHGCRHQRLDQ